MSFHTLTLINRAIVLSIYDLSLKIWYKKVLFNCTFLAEDVEFNSFLKKGVKSFCIYKSELFFTNILSSAISIHALVFKIGEKYQPTTLHKATTSPFKQSWVEFQYSMEPFFLKNHITSITFIFLNQIVR